MQQPLVVDHAQRAIRGVPVVVPDVDFVRSRGGTEPGPEQPQRLRRAPHVAVVVLVAIRALVVERVADADVRVHVSQHRVGHRQHVARHEHREQLAGPAGLLGLPAEPARAADRRVATGRVSGRADPALVDVVQVVGVVRVVHDREHPVALVGRRAIAHRRAGVALRVRIDGDDDDAAPRELDRDAGERLLRPLEAGHDDDQRCRVLTRRTDRLEQVGRDPLPVLRRERDAANRHSTAVALDPRGDQARQQDDASEDEDAPHTRSRALRLRDRRVS